MLDGVPIELGVDFFSINWRKYGKRLVYSGKIDELFGYYYGELEYKTLRFEHKTFDGDFQGVAQVNYTDEHIPYTRITEHKHFNFRNQPKTVVTWEYPEVWRKGAESYYPVNDKKNNALYEKYKALVSKNIIGGGRLFSFRYMDMDAVILQALETFKPMI